MNVRLLDMPLFAQYSHWFIFYVLCRAERGSIIDISWCVSWTASRASLCVLLLCYLCFGACSGKWLAVSISVHLQCCDYHVWLKSITSIGVGIATLFPCFFL